MKRKSFIIMAFLAHQDMWFKNLVLLRITASFDLSVEALEGHLQNRRFQPCGALEATSEGWFPPLGRADAPLVHQTQGFFMICLRKEDKILPASVVNERLAIRVAEIEDREARKLRKKEREALREEILHDMVPKAFSQSRKTYAYIDPKGGWLYVDAGSPRKADDLVAVLRQTLDGFPVKPLSTRERPASVMTRWLAGGAIPEGVTLETECELKSPEEDGGIVRARRHDLEVPEILHHLEAGKEAIKLAFSWNDRLSLVLDEALTIRRLKFLDTIQEAAAEVESDDAATRFDVDFALMSLELNAFLPILLEWFGGEPPVTES
jgi:recombination associated protein RdgC